MFSYLSYTMTEPSVLTARGMRRRRLVDVLDLSSLSKPALPPPKSVMYLEPEFRQFYGSFRDCVALEEALSPPVRLVSSGRVFRTELRDWNGKFKRVIHVPV